MDLVCITGSSRPNGNTDQAAELAMNRWRSLSQDNKGEIISLREHFIDACGFSQTCGDCNLRPDPCAKEDDMPKIIEKMVAADAIVYGTPTYGFGTPSLMQRFIERAGVGYLRFERPLQNKVGGVFVTAHKFNAGAVHDQIVNNLLLNRVIVPGAGFPAILHGGAPGEGLSDYKGLDSLVKMIDRLHEVGSALLGKSLSKGVTEKQRDLPMLETLASQVKTPPANKLQLIG